MEYAPGIPKKEKVSQLPVVKSPEVWTLAIQKHDADKAGTHFDVRLVNPKNKIAYSWASRHNPFEEGAKRMLIRQPDHTMEYATKFSGTIPSGYGAGSVDLIRKEPVQVFRSHDKAIHFATFSGRNPSEYVVVDIGNGDWVLQKKKNYVAELKPKVPPRVKYTSNINLDQAIKDPAVYLSPKIDGALANIVLQAGKTPRLFSPRESKRGETLEYTHKIQDLISKKVPKELDGLTLRGEVYGVNKKSGKAIPASDLAGILNSGHWKALEKTKGVDLRVALFPAIVSVKGKPPEFDIDKQRSVVDRVAKALGSAVHPVGVATTEQEKRRLVSKVQGGHHPLTREGVVAYREGAPPAKAKFEDDLFDVFVRGFESGKNRLVNSIGAFLYSHTPHGKIAGKVGSGLTDEIRQQMSEDPEAFLGRVAKVKAQGKFRSGALRAPRFKDWHMDK